MKPAFRLMSLLIAAVFFAAFSTAASAGSEWELYIKAESLEKAGDLEGAMEIWPSLVDAMAAIGEDEAAGFCAQKMGRALDKLGRYAEAVKYYEMEPVFWDKLPGHADWSLRDLRRADEIRPEIQVFQEESTSGLTAPALAKHEPAWGTLLGAVVTGDPAVRYELDKVPSIYGRRFASVLVYAKWNTYPDETMLKIAKGEGVSLHVSWEPSYGLSAVRDDGYTRTFAKRLKDSGVPVFLRFACEMNGDWTPWSGNPGLYIEKFRLVAGIMRQEAPNVAMVWSPNYVPNENIDSYYPGDEWVDWVGINAYTDYYFNGNPGFPEATATINYQGRNANPLLKFRAVYNRYSSRKPVMISETGVAWANRNPFIDVSDWGADNLRRIYSYLPLLYPRIKAVYYFNYDLGGKGFDFPAFSHYLISGNEKMLRAYRQATASKWYLEDWRQQSPLRYRLLDEAGLSGTRRLVSYVNLADGVSKVEYLLDGQVVCTSGEAPWAVDVNFGGAGTFEVRAYDRYGRLGASRIYQLTPVEQPIGVRLDGRYLNFDVNPVEINGRVLVPVRAILEALGVQVGWEESTHTVIAEKGGDVLRLQVNNPVPTLNGVPLPALDVPAVVINGRTLVPVRFVSENYHMKVNWDGENRAVVINSR